MSNNIQKYVLLEINHLGTKVIGIFNYSNAVKKREELLVKMTMNRYQIDGPFTVNITEEDTNPFNFPYPPIENPVFPKIIKSPKLKIKNPFDEF